ncbi:hypothetical protein KC19_5G117300 [Ceratodon purpureus]|uniref:Uncharacterized protein n=1 Tax=Ceratodon purpureus TaxID=3225 RepID=A0A8T0I284_CERPU|nr:hypothetical protein KC19_5G117300 [Ceratodon purpureus]
MRKSIDQKKAEHPGKIRVLLKDEDELTNLGVEKLQLSECLDKMSSEITNLRNTIVTKDKQKENLQRALQDGAALEKSMQDEIEHQHHRAEELEAEIERLQTQNAEGTAGEVTSTLEMRNLKQALHEHRAQLAEKTNQIDSYKQALRNTAEKLEGVSDQSHEKLTSAFEMAGSLRKLLQERDKQFASLENTCQSREVELADVQRKLEATNSTLQITVGSRDARIRELENMLQAKEKEVQATHQQLQNVELAIDANESRARKLEFDLKIMSNML